jgi:ABC-type nickel/cobalt efflux system permease component RcnA
VFRSVAFIIAFALSLSFSEAIIAQSATTATAPQHAHDHPEHGPNKGELLEIGHGEYHAELLLNEESKEITIYLLDAKAKAYVAVNTTALVVNFKRGGRPFQVKLAAVPQEIDEKGFSSRFAMKSPELMSSLHDAKSDPRFAIRIGNKSYVAKLTHSHDHNHSHGDSHNHDHAGPKK